MAQVVQFIIRLIETIGLRAVIERFGRLLFHPPHLPLPELPRAARVVPGLQATIVATLNQLIELAFFDGVLQGICFGFTFAMILVAMQRHRLNVPGNLKNVVGPQR